MSRLTSALLWALVPSAVLARYRRSYVQDSTDDYLESQTLGQPYPMSLPDKIVYRVNSRFSSPKAGIITKPLTIARQHRLYDHDRCATKIITDPKDPYAIDTQLPLDGSSPIVTVTSIDSILTTTGDRLFNASHMLSHVLKEDWDMNPSDTCDTRGTRGHRESTSGLMRSRACLGRAVQPARGLGVHRQRVRGG